MGLFDTPLMFTPPTPVISFNPLVKLTRTSKILRSPSSHLANFPTCILMILSSKMKNEFQVEKKTIPKRVSGECENRVKDFPKPNWDHTSNIMSMEFFELFFTDGIMNLLDEETRKYNLFKNCAWRYHMVTQ